VDGGFPLVLLKVKPFLENLKSKLMSNGGKTGILDVCGESLLNPPPELGRGEHITWISLY